MPVNATKTYVNNYKATRSVNDSFWHSIYHELRTHGFHDHLLDIGCGPGQFGVWAEKQCNDLSVTCLDMDDDMLSQIPSDSQFIKPVLGSVYDMPFDDRSFQAAIAINVFHMLDLSAELTSEITRVLYDTKLLLVAMVNKDELPAIWEYQYFPSALKIDENRLPSIPNVTSCLETGGFRCISQKKSIMETRHFDASFLRRVSRQHMSALAMIPRLEFESGLDAIRDDLLNSPTKGQDVMINLLTFKGL